MKYREKEQITQIEKAEVVKERGKSLSDVTSHHNNSVRSVEGRECSSSSEGQSFRVSVSGATSAPNGQREKCAHLRARETRGATTTPHCSCDHVSCTFSAVLPSRAKSCLRHL